MSYVPVLLSKRKTLVFLLLIVVSFAGAWVSSQSGSTKLRYPFTPRKAVQPLELSALEVKLAASPLDPALLNEMASSLLVKAKRQEDETIYRQVEKLAMRSLGVLPDFNPSAKLLLSRVYQARHEFERSLTLVRIVLKESPSEESLSLMVTGLLAIGEPESALSFAETSVRLRPSVNSYGLRALVMENLGRLEEAEYDFLRAIAVEDYGQEELSAWIRATYARFLMRIGRFSEARKALEEALKIEPDHLLATQVRAEIALARGAFEKASKLFLDGFKNSRRISMLRGYANSEKQLGHDSIAQQWLGEARKLVIQDLATSQTGHILDLAAILLDFERPEETKEARNLLEREYITRKDCETLYLLARAYFALTEYEKCRTTLQKILATGTRQGRLYGLLSKVENALNHPYRAKFYDTLAQKFGSVG